MLNVVGLDPSMRNFGMVKGELDLSNNSLTIIEMELIETVSDAKNKKVVRKNSDDLNRAKKLHRAMTEFLSDASMVFVEIPVGSQSARAMASYGMCIGVIASIGIPLIQVTPYEVKLAATGKTIATKADMIAWATGRYPEAGWFTRKSKGEYVFTNKNEHLADAVAAIHAGVKTDTFLTAKSFFKDY